VSENSHDLASRLAATGQMLVRSDMEIGHTLEAMCKSGVPLAASLRSGEVLFLSCLLRIDREQRTIVVACSDVKHANSELFASAAVAFGCNHEGIHYEFFAAEPRETEHAGKPAIELSFPVALLMLQRRKQPRAAIPPELPLRCEVRLGPMAFDAQVIDVGLDALGVIVYDPAIRIEPGLRLEGVRIVHPEREAVVIDLEVQHVSKTVLKDGTYANRAGCRILGTRKDIEDLIRLFVSDLGPADEAWTWTRSDS
jgi:c-di-GMP-binding flagellar brake protein YcgR